MADLDQLSIKISANSDSATKAVDSLVKSLEKLNSALNNYAGKNSYTQGLENIATTFTTLSKAVNSIDSDRIKTLASNIRSLTSSFSKINGVAEKINFQTASDSARIFGDEIKKSAEQIASQFGITDQKVIAQLTAQFRELAAAVNSGNYGQDANGVDRFGEAYRNVINIISENKNVIGTVATEFEELVQSVRAMNDASSGGVSFAGVFDGAKEFINDYAAMRATLGKGWAQDNGGISFDSWVQGLPTSELAVLNSMITQMGGDVNDVASQFAALVEIVKEYNAAGGGTKGVIESEQTSMEGLTTSLDGVINGFGKLTQLLGQTDISEEQNTDAISQMANGLERIANINIQEMPGLTALVNNIRQLGLGPAQKAVAIIPELANGLETLVTNMNQLNGLTFDATSLNGLLDAITRLGRSNSAKAAANIPFIADGLKTLVSSMNQLGTVSFNTESLSSLIQSIGVLGGKSVTNAISNLPRLTQAISNLIATLSKLPAVNQNVIDTINAIASLASQGQKVGSAFNGMNTSVNKTSSVLPKLTANLNKTTKSSFNLASAFGKVYATYWLLFRAFSKLKESISLSSDLTEVQNVVDKSFGDMAYKINNFAKTSIDTFGMSILTAKQVASEFQAMGNAMGITDAQVAASNSTWSDATGLYDNAASSLSDVSMNLTKLAADMGSFYNVEYEDVAENLASGVFTGQTRVLKLAS